MHSLAAVNMLNYLMHRPMAMVDLEIKVMVKVVMELWAVALAAISTMM